MIKSPSKNLSLRKLREIVSRDGLLESGLEYSVIEARELLNEKEGRIALREFSRQLKGRLTCDPYEMMRQHQDVVLNSLQLNTGRKI